MILALSFLLISAVFAENTEKSQVTIKEFPEWHALKKFNSEEGFQLREAAIKSMGISFDKLRGRNAWRVPSSAIAHVKYSHGVYRIYEGWITFILVEIISKNSGNSLIKSVDLREGDQIAVTGVTELRLTEADLHSDTVDSCSH